MKLNDIIIEGKGIPQKPKSYASRNPVAKNIEKFNRPSTHPDKKKELKRKGPDFKSYDMDEATTLVSDKSHIIDSILTQVKEKAMKDDNMIKRLASLIHSTADVRYDSNPRGSWEITPNDKLGKTDWEPMRNEANANQQASLYNPDGKTYRQQKMPHLDPRDPINKAQGFDSFDNDDLSYDQDLDKEIVDRQKNKQVSKMLDTLKPAERKLISLRFGLDGEDQHSLEEVGDIFGITRERTRQAEAWILRKFRHPERAGFAK